MTGSENGNGCSLASVIDPLPVKRTSLHARSNSLPAGLEKSGRLNDFDDTTCALIASSQETLWSSRSKRQTLRGPAQNGNTSAGIPWKLQLTLERKLDAGDCGNLGMAWEPLAVLVVFSFASPSPHWPPRGLCIFLHTRILDRRGVGRSRKQSAENHRVCSFISVVSILQWPR